MFSLIELEKAQAVGRPIDAQKMEGLKLKHNMDIDEMVYVGDSDMGATGLINNPAVPVFNVAETWNDADTTPDMILADINAILEQAWGQTAYSLCPTHLLLPPLQYTLLNRPVTEAGSISILKYVSENSLANGQNGRPLVINPLKWLMGAGAGSKNRAVAYTKEEGRVRFPLVPLQHTPVEFRGLHQVTTYFGSLGEVEFVYPETVTYADGI